ncbi:MAG: tetratricopeptide repeat protein [Anaerolineae bacterium]
MIVTKILRPRRRDDLLHRRRLVDFIHAHIERKLIIVSAPAGYGKTSLLIDFAHDSDLPVCWFTLDERDSDPRVFLEYLVESIRRRFPKFGQQINAILKGGGSRLPDSETIAAALVNDMVQAIGEYFVVVLDDYHMLDDNSVVHTLLDTLLRYLPEHCHILLASRTLPPLTLTRMAARQEADGLSVHELRFTVHEIQQLMRQNHDLDLPDEQAQELAQELDGWIAGLLLTKHTLWEGMFAGMIRAQGEAQAFDYLATEVFEQQPEDVQQFMLHSAILDSLSPELCDELIQSNASMEMLRRLESQNLFITRLEGPGEWYRYHQLFREFLLSHLQSTDPDCYRELQLRAAQLSVQRAEPASAIHHYLEAEAHKKAAEVIESVADETFNTGRWTTLARWIDALPQNILLEQPNLLTHRAKVWIQVGRLADAITELDRACEVFQTETENEPLAEALVFRSVALRMQSNYEEAIHQCTHALEMLGPDHDNSSIAAQAYRNIGIAYGNLGELSDSIKQLNRALSLYESRGEAYHIASVQHDLATTHLRSGDLASASTHYRLALRHWRETSNAARISETLNAMGCALYYQGAYESARELLEEALVEAKKAQYSRVEAAVLAGLGDIARARSRNGEALSNYEQALRVAEQINEGSIIGYALNAMGLTHCAMGEHNRAKTYIAEALSLGEQSGSAYDIGLSQDALGVLSQARSDPEMAVKHFTEAQKHFKNCGAKRELAIADLHLAQALFNSAPATADALAPLEQALALADELGYDHFLIAEGRQAVDLYKHAVNQPGKNGRLSNILEHLGEEVPELPATAITETLPTEAAPLLRIQALGLAQVWLHSEQVTKKQWDSATTKELFFFLLTHPEGVRKDKILEVFWPEATPAKASSAFHSTNYRLRRALQDQDCILYRNGVYTINPELSYWYDVEVFQNLIEEAKHTESSHEQASLYLEAIDLYKGDYLEEFYSDWHYFRREELQRQYFDALTHVAEYFRDNDRSEEALPLYEKIVAVDPYQEQIHRAIMQTHLELGHRAAAVKHYQQLQAFLRDDLDIDPMPETIDLYNAIIAGEEQVDGDEEHVE